MDYRGFNITKETSTTLPLYTARAPIRAGRADSGAIVAADDDPIAVNRLVDAHIARTAPIAPK